MTSMFWWVLASQAIFAGGLVVCVAVAPSYVFGANQGGISNYGTDGRTIVPFAVAFAGNAALTAAAAASVPTMSEAAWLRALLSLLAVLLLALLVSAGVYKRSQLLRKLHFGIGIGLIAYETLFGLWLLLFVGAAWFGWLLWGLMLLADILCILAVLRIVEKLFIGQVAASFAFGVLLLVAFA